MESYENISDLSNRLLEFCKEGFLCDTVVVAGGDALKVHGVFLAAASFELREQLSKQAENEVRCIVLPGIDYTALCVAVYFMYTGNLVLPSGCDEEYYDLLKSSLINLGISSARIKDCSVSYERNNELQFSSLSSYQHLRHIDYDLDDVDIDDQDSNPDEDDDSDQEDGCENRRKSRKRSTGNKKTKRSTSNKKTKRSQNGYYTTAAAEEAAGYAEANGDNDVEYGEDVSVSNVCHEGTDIAVYESVSFETEFSAGQDEHYAENMVEAVQAGSESPLNSPCETEVKQEWEDLDDSEDEKNFQRSSSTEDYETDEATEVGSDCDDVDEALDSANVLDTEESLDNVYNQASIEGHVVDTPSELASSGTNENSRLGKFLGTTRVSEMKYGRNSKTPDVYKCQICKKSLPNKRALRQHRLSHIRAIDGETKQTRRRRAGSLRSQKHKCDKCNRKFSLARLLEEHQNVHMEGGQSFVCSICGCEKATKSALWSHKRSHKNTHHKNEQPVSLLCHLCGKEYTNKSSMRAHMRKPHTEFKCETCGATFNTKGKLSRHSIVQHGIYMRCWKRKATSGRNADPAAENHVCYICGFIAHSTKSYSTHMWDHRRPCTVCSEVFQGDAQLEEHAKLAHPGVECHPPNWCSVCKRSFVRESNLREHMLLHSNLKPFPCQFCRKKFVSTKSLSAHIKGCHGEASYRKDKNKKKNRDIEPVPAGVTKIEDNKFKCDECGVTMMAYTTMRAHIYSHGGTLPYSCDVCGKQFLYESYLKSHIMIHTGELPFACPECGKKFRQQGHLSMHMHTHRGTKPYSCELCGKGYSSRFDLCNHYTRQHNLEVVSTKINKHRVHTVNLPTTAPTTAATAAAAAAAAADTAATD